MLICCWELEKFNFFSVSVACLANDILYFALFSLALYRLHKLFFKRRKNSFDNQRETSKTLFCKVFAVSAIRSRHMKYR